MNTFLKKNWTAIKKTSFAFLGQENGAIEMVWRIYQLKY